MSDLSIACRTVLSAADSLGLRCALVGGFAVSVRAEPRFTRDVDLVVAVADDAGSEELLRLLLSVGHTLLANVEQDAVERLATSRLRLTGGEAVDLLFASSGIENEVAEAAEPVEVLPGLTVPVALTGHLIALKLLSRDDVTRPQDAGDLRALLGVASEPDLDLTRASVALIHERGFARGRDLLGDLQRLRPNS